MTTSPAEDATTGGRTVLVVDDEADIRFVARLLLEGAGLTVLEAFDGRGGLEELRRHHVDLVVTDLNMPGMDGLTLLARIRAAPETRTLPVIVWSERAPEDLDADLTLAKGLGVRRLVDDVTRLLQEHADAPTDDR